MESGEIAIDSYEPLISFLGRQYPAAWRMAADLYAVSGDSAGLTRAINALTALLESAPAPAERISTWRRIAELSGRNGDLASELNAWTQIAGITDATIRDISDAANALNSLHYNFRQRLDRELLSLAFERAIAALAPHVDSAASATDLSRLAWLYLNTSQVEKAKSVTLLGLKVDPLNSHLVNLKSRLDICDASGV